MHSPLRVLHLEDKLADTELVQSTLEAEGIATELRRVETESDFVGALQGEDVDLILADYTLPSFDGLSALRIAQQRSPQTPFIFVSGTLGEDVAIEALKTGAVDYVLKTHLGRLGPSVTRALAEAREKADRKRVEKALRQSEKDLRDLIETMPTMAFSTTPDGSSEFATGSWLEYTGLSREAARGAGWIATIHPDDLDKHVGKWRASMASGEPFESEVRHRSARGEYRWFLVRAVPLADSRGQILKWYGTLTDIEDRKRAEEALRRSEAYLTEAQRLSHTGSWAFSPISMKMLYWSSELFRTWGFDPQEGPPEIEAVLDRIHPEDRQRIYPLFEHGLKGQLMDDTVVEHRIVLPDGAVKYVHGISHPVFNDAGQVIEYVGTSVDVTEAKRGDALFAGEKRLLEMIATGVALKEILKALCIIIEEYRSGTLASILLLRPDGLHLDSVAGPSLPKSWRREMERQPIGPCAGSCGTAAYRGSPVIVSDIASDPLWEVPEHRAAALQHGLRASWSNPILSSDGKVLGTFCIYGRETQTPTPRDLELIEKATYLARVAIERDRSEEALRTSEERYRDLINASPDAIYVMDADGICMMANPASAKLIGRPEDELIGSSIVQTFLPEERHFLKENIERLKVEGSLRFERKFLRHNGEVIPVEVSLAPLRGRYYQSIIRDISHRKRREALLAGENRVLEMVAKGNPLDTTLDRLCLLVEEQSPGVLASILLLDANGKQLQHGGAPSLPKAYTHAIDGAYIGPSAGSCGTAAHRAEQVIVSDIATDPLWADYRDLALSHSLRACWSTPIFSSRGKVIGTFAMYYRKPRTPTPQEQETIKHITHLADIAIERKLAERARRESEAYLEEAQRLSHTGSWAWTPATGEIRYWSEETFRVLGFDPHDGPPRYETFFQRLHPDEQVRLREIFENAVRTKADFDADYRIVHPSSAVRNIHAVGHPVCDDVGNLVEFVGTVIDVTESKRAEEALRASEQVARGQVEALTYSLDVLATAPAPEKFIGQMLSTIGRLLDAQSVTLWLRDEETDALLFRAGAEGSDFAACDPNHPFVKDPLLWKKDPVLQETVFRGVPVICEDVENDPIVFSDIREYFKSKGTKKYLTIPTLIRGRVRGFIGIRHGSRSPYRPEEVELAQALAHQTMLAIQLTALGEQGRQAAVLAERNRMARDIHDTLAQGFTGVIVQLEAVADAISSGDHKEAEKYLLRASDLARQSLNEARRSVHALRPEALRRANFWDALKGIIKNTTTGSPLSIKAKLKGKVPDLPPDWEENLMHIGQEALTNTLKYAHADRFEALLTCNAKELQLQFEDNGDGFAVKDRHDGFGLAGMRERVEEMGGELKIVSARGKGTKISVVLPLNGNQM